MIAVNNRLELAEKSFKEILDEHGSIAVTAAYEVLRCEIIKELINPQYVGLDSSDTIYEQAYKTRKTIKECNPKHIKRIRPLGHDDNCECAECRLLKVIFGHGW